MIYKQSGITSSISNPVLPSSARVALTTTDDGNAALAKCRAAIASVETAIHHAERGKINRLLRRLKMQENNRRQSFNRPPGR